MPWPNPYNGGQDNDLTRSIDNVHIEPSIREGLFLVSSLYGKDASLPLKRYPPVNLTQPFITGSGVIPNTLRCEIGVWDASPTADYFYQWMADGADIPGANNATITTDATFDGVTLTCEVRADNGIGEDYAVTSNSVLCSLIEPIEVRDGDFFGVTGLQANKIQTVLDKRDMIISGLGTDNRLDTNRGVAYFLTGIGADNRLDANYQNIMSITGLDTENALTNLESPGICVISSDKGVPLVEGIQQPIHLRNPNAELGLLGWNPFGVVTFGSEFDDINDPPEGDLGFIGGFDVHPDGSNTPYTYLYQDVLMWDEWLADIDAGLCYVDVYWLQNMAGSNNGDDKANIRLEFYAADGTTLLTFNDGPGLWTSPYNVWFSRKIEGAAIPALTRYVRIQVEFLWSADEDNDITAAIDNIRPFIRKGDLINTRSFGPTYTHWRLKFTAPNAWSGAALSELEFQDGSNLNLISGGSIIFGSAGLGVANADAAFDGLINTNYWAGAENSISAGTSWLGYEKPGLWRPEYVNVIARQGSNALQVGNAFDIEASEDGIRWDVVERYDSTRLERFWNSGEARLFKIQPSGPFPYITEAPYVIPTLGRATDSNDDQSAKGIVFHSQARMDITHLRFGTLNQVFDYRWQICHISGEKSESWYFGVVSELHEDGIASNVVDGGLTNSDKVWQEITLASPMEVNVDDYFLITLIDHELDTNPNELDDPNEGRLTFVSNWNDGQNFDLRRPFCRKLQAWRLGSKTEPYDLGETNPGPFQSGTGYDFAIDFKGNIY